MKVIFIGGREGTGRTIGKTSFVENGARLGLVLSRAAC
jgi:hypothetical protein